MNEKEMEKIHSDIYDGSIDFYSLNQEQRSFALGIVISGILRGNIDKRKFNEEQLKFLKEAQTSGRLV